MGESEIIKILKKNKWIKSTEIRNKLELSQGAVGRILRNLLKERQVIRREYKQNGIRGYEWILK